MYTNEYILATQQVLPIIFIRLTLNYLVPTSMIFWIRVHFTRKVTRFVARFEIIYIYIVSDDRTRTYGGRFMKEVLYQLSYITLYI